jgi:hypothetical protein
MISTRVIQLQLLPNHLSLRARLSERIKTIERRPHGNRRKVEGFFDDCGAMMTRFIEE